MTSTQKFILVPVLALTVLGGGALLGYAQLSQAEVGMGRGMMGGMMGNFGKDTQGVHGELTARDGTSLTVKGKNGTTYTVDASHAEVRTVTQGAGLDNGSLDDLSVGDIVGVRGAVDGTNVTATDIMNGDHPMMGGMHGHRGGGVMGEVTAVNGTTLTVKTKSGDTVTVDTSDAIVQRVVDASREDLKVGDQIGVHGTRSGDTVTAEHIMDDVEEFRDEE